jgi:calcineurin-like phosphoesterase family protein
MSKEVFLISDLHFGHSAMYERPFLRPDGTPVRPFASAEEADEEMIFRWNSTVRPCDKVYVLGDIAIPMGGLKAFERLNGDKVLIAGNHDWPFEKKLGQYFRSVRAYWKLDNFALSHVPIHPDSLGRFDGNIHGHLHAGRVLLSDGSIDPRYFCVCVEHTEYRPLAWEEVKRRFYAQQNDGFRKADLQHAAA